MSSTSGSTSFNVHLAGIKEQSEELYEIIREEQKHQVNKWTDEQTCLESFVLALSSTRDLLKQEQLRIHSDLENLTKDYETQAAQHQKGLDRSDISADELEVVDLQKKLIELNNRMLDVNFELEALSKQLEGTMRTDEQYLYDTKLLVLTDTKRILQEEIDVLREEIFRRESSAKYEADRRSAETTGWADLSRLEEQLARLDVKIDRAKQLLYFPPVKGYRFTGGSGGVYTAAKELYIAEVSGRFLLSCQAVTKPDGSKVARLTLELGGASFHDLARSKAMSPLSCRPPDPPPTTPVPGAATAPLFNPTAPRPSPRPSPNITPSPSPPPPGMGGSDPRWPHHSPGISPRPAPASAGPLPHHLHVATASSTPPGPSPRPAHPTTSDLEEAHMLAALTDSPTHAAAAGGAGPSGGYVPTEQLVQQISRGKAGKGAMVMGLLDGLNRRRAARHSDGGAAASAQPSPDSASKGLGRLGRKTMDSIDLESRKEGFRALANRAREGLEGGKEGLGGKREQLRALAHKAKEGMRLEERKEALRQVAARTKDGLAARVAGTGGASSSGAAGGEALDAPGWVEEGPASGGASTGSGSAGRRGGTWQGGSAGGSGSRGGPVAEGVEASGNSRRWKRSSTGAWIKDDDADLTPSLRVLAPGSTPTGSASTTPTGAAPSTSAPWRQPSVTASADSGLAARTSAAAWARASATSLSDPSSAAPSSASFSSSTDPSSTGPSPRPSPGPSPLTSAAPSPLTSAAPSPRTSAAPSPRTSAAPSPRTSSSGSIPAPSRPPSDPSTSNPASTQPSPRPTAATTPTISPRPAAANTPTPSPRFTATTPTISARPTAATTPTPTPSPRPTAATPTPSPRPASAITPTPSPRPTAATTPTISPRPTTGEGTDLPPSRPIAQPTPPTPSSSPAMSSLMQPSHFFTPAAPSPTTSTTAAPSHPATPADPSGPFPPASTTTAASTTTTTSSTATSAAPFCRPPELQTTSSTASSPAPPAPPPPPASTSSTSSFFSMFSRSTTADEPPPSPAPSPSPSPAAARTPAATNGTTPPPPFRQPSSTPDPPPFTSTAPLPTPVPPPAAPAIPAPAPTPTHPPPVAPSRTQSSGIGASGELGDLEGLLGGSLGRQDTPRTGVCVNLLGEGVEVYGERGSKVPKISVKEVALEVEALLSASFEFSSMLGWQAPDRVTFEVQRLERTVQGANIPLPRTLIKTVLNIVLPKVLTKVALTLLPVELGAYLLACEEPLHLQGEFRVLGPPLAAFSTDLTLAPPAPEAPNGAPPAARSRASTAAQQQQQATRDAAAAAEAGRQLLGITEAHAAALAELFGGKWCLAETPRPLTIMELCRFYTLYSASASWHPLCNMWNRALQMVLERQGCADSPLQFRTLMECQVAALARKPARVALAIDRLDVRLDADAAATAARDFLERTAREVHKNSQGKKEVLFKQPLDVQLEALQHYYTRFQSAVSSFKTKFKSAGGTVVATADSDSFQAALQNLHYEGPATLQVPLPGQVDEEGGVSCRLKLPDPEKAMSSAVGRLTRLLKKLASASLASAAASSDSAALQAAGLGLQAADALSRLPPDVASAVADWQSRLGATPGSPLARRFREIFDGPPLPEATLGTLTIHRLAASLVLDEELLAKELAVALSYSDDPEELARMLTKKGPLFIGGLASGAASAPNGGLSEQQQCMWGHVYSGRLSRVRLEAQRLLLSSGVSPLTAAKLLHAVLVGVAHQFQAADTKRLAVLDAAMARTKELLGKDALSALAALSASAVVANGRLRVSVRGAEGQAEGEWGGTGGAGQQPYYPLYLVNDVNLVTALESAKSVMDS